MLTVKNNRFQHYRFCAIPVLLIVMLLPALVFSSGFEDSGLELRSTDENGPAGEISTAKLIPGEDILWALWLDNRNEPERFGGIPCLQGITENGSLVFQSDGLILEDFGWCPDETAFDAITDGEGGLIVCATDEDREGFPKVIQRYDPTGEELWNSPVIVEDVLLLQKMASMGGGESLVLLSPDAPSLELLHIDSEGETTQWTIFESIEGRNSAPVGIFTKTGGYLVLGRVVRSANSSEMRRLWLNSDGQPIGSLDGLLYYYGRVNEFDAVYLGSNKSLQFIIGNDFDLLGQYFPTTGYPNWTFEGVRLVQGAVISSGACAADNGFWLIARQNNDDNDRIILRRWSFFPRPQTDALLLSDSPGHVSLINPAPDGGGGIFLTYHDSNDRQSVVLQLDSGGNLCEGYEEPVPLDNLEFPAEAKDLERKWNDFFVVYIQDRWESGRNGLVLQKFTNILPDYTPESTKNDILSSFEIFSAYPNPFNGWVSIDIHMPTNSLTELEVYDLMGRLASSRTLENVNAGRYLIPVNFENLPSGSYIIKASSAENTCQKRVTLVK